MKSIWKVILENKLHSVQSGPLVGFGTIKALIRKLINGASALVHSHIPILIFFKILTNVSVLRLETRAKGTWIFAKNPLLSLQLSCQSKNPSNTTFAK